jgi:hypothetical protein
MSEQWPPRIAIELVEHAERLFREQGAFGRVLSAQDVERKGVLAVSNMDIQRLRFTSRRNLLQNRTSEVATGIQDGEAGPLFGQVLEHIEEQRALASTGPPRDRHVPGKSLSWKQNGATVIIMADEQRPFAVGSGTLQCPEPKCGPMPIHSRIAFLDRDRGAAPWAVKCFEAMPVTAADLEAQVADQFHTIQFAQEYATLIIERLKSMHAGLSVR